MPKFQSVIIMLGIAFFSFWGSVEASEVNAVLFRQKAKLECDSKARQDYCGITLVDGGQFKGSYFCRGNSDGKTCPKLDQCKAEWETNKFKYPVSRVLKNEGNVIQKCTGVSDPVKLRVLSGQGRKAATAADSCHENNRFEPVCITDEMLCSSVDSNVASAGMICRSSQCGSITSCIEDPEWDVVSDAKMIDEPRGGAERKGMSDGGGAAGAL